MTFVEDRPEAAEADRCMAWARLTEDQQITTIAVNLTAIGVGTPERIEAKPIEEQGLVHLVRSQGRKLNRARQEGF